jgi:hypothetical protein
MANENGKSYLVQYPNGITSACSEAAVEKLKKREGYKVLGEVNRLSGDIVKKFSGGSAGDKAAD